jgi:hypothetical protein
MLLLLSRPRGAMGGRGKVVQIVGLGLTLPEKVMLALAIVMWPTECKITGDQDASRNHQPFFIKRSSLTYTLQSCSGHLHRTQESFRIFLCTPTRAGSCTSCIEHGLTNNKHSR